VNNSENMLTMQELLDNEEQEMKRIKTGDIVKGTVILVNDNEVMVNIGYKSDGIITKSEFSSDSDVVLTEAVKENDEIEVYVIKLNDGEGNVLLSRKRLEGMKVWDDFVAMNETGEVFPVRVVEVVKGGAMALYKGIKGFIPASHISMGFTKDLAEFVGKTLEVKVIEVDKSKKKLVFSRKEVEKKDIESKKAAVLDSIQKGEVRKGQVKRLTDFGAFVDLGGIDGLIHVSELSWKRVNSPAEVVSEGDMVEVYVIDFDRDKERISLSLKQVTPDPWSLVSSKYNVGDIVEGTVLRLPNFGAFIELEPGLDGFCHISQIDQKHIAKPSDVLSEGQKVSAKIIEIKPEEKKISLSIKEAQGGEEAAEGYSDETPVNTVEDSIKE